MDIQSVAQLVRVMEESTLSVLEVQLGEMRVHMEKQANASAKSSYSPAAQQIAPVQPSAQQPQQSESAAVAQETAVAEQAPCKDGWKEVKSPMVGAFHVAKADGKPVGIGTVLKKGATVCVIEAMKLMNDISMPENGEIVWVVAKEGDMVEYGQLLFHYK